MMIDLELLQVVLARLKASSVLLEIVMRVGQRLRVSLVTILLWGSEFRLKTVSFSRQLRQDCLAMSWRRESVQVVLA